MPRESGRSAKHDRCDDDGIYCYKVTPPRTVSMASFRIRSGMRVGGWRVLGKIDTGGNSNVWKVSNDRGEAGALKLLRHSNAKRANQRFKDEVESLRACQDISGVLPLLDAYLPDDPTKHDPAWLVSVLATPLEDAVQEIELDQAIEICLSLATTLSEMHRRGYSHRDIKPGNIFQYKGSWCLGDFGLVDFPNKAALTGEGEKLGPAHYIAPEMLNDSVNADGTKADVYSLGKLLWKLATGQNYPLPGIHSRNIPALTISGNVMRTNLSALDGLLEAMTQIDPNRRPSMAHVASELSAWIAPSPPAMHDTDLLPFTKRARALREPHTEQQNRRMSLQAMADEALASAFAAFTPAIEQIKLELERADIGRVTIEAPAGGNGTFYHAVTGNQNVGRSDRTWLHEYSVTAWIDAGNKRGWLKSGINLGIQNVQDDADTLFDIYSPVVAAAGHIVTAEMLVSGAWQTSSKLIWGEHDSLFLRQPSETKVLTRLSSELRDNIAVAVEALIATVEALDQSDVPKQHPG